MNSCCVYKTMSTHVLPNTRLSIIMDSNNISRENIFNEDKYLSLSKFEQAARYIILRKVTCFEHVFINDNNNIDNEIILLDNLVKSCLNDQEIYFNVLTKEFTKNGLLYLNFDVKSCDKNVELKKFFDQHNWTSIFILAHAVLICQQLWVEGVSVEDIEILATYAGTYIENKYTSLEEKNKYWASIYELKPWSALNMYCASFNQPFLKDEIRGQNVEDQARNRESLGEEKEAEENEERIFMEKLKLDFKKHRGYFKNFKEENKSFKFGGIWNLGD